MIGMCKKKVTLIINAEGCIDNYYSLYLLMAIIMNLNYYYYWKTYIIFNIRHI